MNNYFSNFISRFGANHLIPTSYSNAADNAKVPEINYITLFNPKWADDHDESLDNLSKQILFFITPGLTDPMTLDEDQLARQKGEHLNVVGLLRGSWSLAKEFGKSSGSMRVLVSGAAIIVVEIEEDFFIALSVALPSTLSERHEAIRIQMESLIQAAHRTFKLLNPPFSKLKEIYSVKGMSDYLSGYWQQFMGNFNDASKVQFGPKLLGWPTRMNPRGVFQVLPHNSYRKSSVKVPDSLRPDLEDLIKDFSLQPAGYFVVNYNKAIPKKCGVIYSKSDWGNLKIENEALTDLFNLLEFLEYHGELVTDRLSKRNTLSHLFDQLESNSVEVSDDEEDDNASQSHFSMNPAAAIELLHPVNITNNLVIQPLSTTVSTTVNGLRSLGLAVNLQLPAAPSWWSLGGFRGSEAPAPVTEGDDAHSKEDSGSFILGANGDQMVTRLLIHLPTIIEKTKDLERTPEGSESEATIGATDDGINEPTEDATDATEDATKDGGKITTTEVREYLLVLYSHEGIVQGFIFDSSHELLSQKPFYEDLKWDVCEQTMGVIQECFQISSGGIGLSTSISSLPNPLMAIITGKLVESQIPQYEDIDSDFFFIVYDTQEHSYQTSLPYLPISVPIVDGEVVKIAQSFNNAIFHLHDQLTDHFVVKSAGRVFTPVSVVNEHLHKFSSNKSNNWLFYSIRHKTKAIVIIRNYNTKHKHTNKSKNIARPEGEGLLNQISESVHDYASLGFLDTLGEDVKVWLEKLGRNEA
ncbi:CIC11C00000004095 [Sungouiella intermedia]|uniref:CIC11C00000004095 n=1 Tax=Sungouiella intermedia TaxID=45354 RepID=A0A1L0BGV7_9ASCO|nr:CIC11C00000004095 [[Candida] intermedia]